MSFPTPRTIISEPCKSCGPELELAADPETPPAVLSRMANACARNEALAEALALNPNTPLPELFKLWCERPFAALENPIANFHTFCTGTPLHQFLPREVQHRLYVALRSSPRAAELEEHLPVEARLRWLSGPEPDIGWFFRSPGGGVIQRPKNASEAERIRKENALALRFFELLGRDPSAEVRKDMVAKLPLHSLQAYLNEPLAEIRLALAQRVCSDHGGRGDEEHRVLEIMRDSLSRDPEAEVRCSVAAGDAIQGPVFERLAYDPSSAVRMALAGGTSKRQAVQCGAAWEALAGGHADLARLVALNESCPVRVRLKLIEHSDTLVRRNAWSAIAFCKVEVRRQLVRKALSLLTNPPAHPELEAIAANPTIPESLAVKIAGIEGTLARIVAANPQLPETTRRRLVSGPCASTARVAAEHATANETLWAALRHPADSVRAVLIRKHGMHAVRIRFKLAKDPSLKVRQALLRRLVDGKNDHPQDHRHTRLQVRLLLDSATPPEKTILLKSRPLRRLLAEWSAEPATNQSKS